MDKEPVDKVEVVEGKKYIMQMCSKCNSITKHEDLEQASKYRCSCKPEINHPAHYQSKKMEVIEIIEAFDLDFNLGNVIKYVLRSDKKGNAKQDLEKAIWYLNRVLKKYSDS